ncbi:MAG: CoA transferase [Hyphomicrobiaceae bacterium]
MTARAALEEVWTIGGGERSALEHVALTGQEPALPSSFAVGTMAQASIAASALAAAEVWRLRTGSRQAVSVDMHHAAIEFRSEHYMRVPGVDPRTWDKVAGLYTTRDGRHIRLHTNLPHHRSGMLDLLGADYDRDAVRKAIAQWDGEPLETAAAERGLVATMTRTPEEWAAHGQGRAVAALPLFEMIRIGDAPPRRIEPGRRPLEGIRVLDLTRIIAGPVCGRTLAAHGADVLHVAGPKLPSAPLLVMDTGRGKRTTFIELTEQGGRETLERLAAGADVFVQGYRPGAMASKGFDPERLAGLSPGIVCVSLSAYGHEGPWAGRRGFDSLVQNANGLNIAEARAFGQTDAPKELPAQALDHGSGYLMAAGAMMALKRQRTEGGSWLVRVSLAQTGHWFWRLGRLEADALRAPMPSAADVADLLETTPSGFGPMTAVRHSARLSQTPACWRLPSVPLGTHSCTWEDAA